MTKTAKLKLKIETVPVTSLHEDPGNAMSHDEASINAIAASLSRFGQQKPIATSEHTEYPQLRALLPV